MTTLPLLPLDAEAPADQLAAARAKIAYFGRLLFERTLTDAAGGNLSIRVGNRICISPRYSGQQRQWQLAPEDVLICDLDRNILSGTGQISRESNVHFSVHREFGTHGTAVVHCHPRNLLVFAATNRPMEPILEANRKFGVTPVVPFAPAHSPKLADHVRAALRGREALISKQAAAVIAPWHGLFLMSKDLDAGFDAAERLDNNAYILLMGGIAFGAAAMAQHGQQMEETIGGFQE
jgi:L-fuculose-phosphate aldolase